MSVFVHLSVHPLKFVCNEIVETQCPHGYTVVLETFINFFHMKLTEPARFILRLRSCCSY